MDIRQRILEIIARISRREAGALTPDLELVGDLELDSPKVLLLLCEIEDATGLEISDEEVAEVVTIGDVLDLVERLA